MDEFRRDIKDKILRKVNTTIWDFEEDKDIAKNKHGYDALDEIILLAADQLNTRYVKIFSFFYHKDDKKRAQAAFNGRGGSKLPIKTIERYKSFAFNRVIELVVNDAAAMAKVRELVSG